MNDKIELCECCKNKNGTGKQAETYCIVCGKALCLDCVFYILSEPHCSKCG